MRALSIVVAILLGAPAALLGTTGCRTVLPPLLDGGEPADGGPEGGPDDAAQDGSGDGPRETGPLPGRDGGSPDWSNDGSEDAGPPATFGATPVFADELNEATFWGAGDTSTSGHWRPRFTDGTAWLEAHADRARALLVDRPGGVRALAIESQPLLRQGTTPDWCRWALGKSMLGSPERDQALDRCRVHTVDLRTYAGWDKGTQQGPKFGPGIKVEVRVSFAEAIRAGQRFSVGLAVDKPVALYDEAEKARQAAGASGVAYDGLASNGAEINLVQLAHGHRSWTTAGALLQQISRFHTGVVFDRRAPFDAASNPDGRTGPGALERSVDTLNKEAIFGSLSHLDALYGNGPAATFDLRSGWLIFTLEWTKVGASQSRIDFYVRPDNGDPGQARYRYFSVDNFQTYDTSADHYLVLGNQVEQAFTDYQDGVWRDIEQAPAADGHNTPTSTKKLQTAAGEYTFDVYPEDRVLIDWIRVYEQQ